MPTKGPSRNHEAFTTQPSSAYAPETELDTRDDDSLSGRLGGGWMASGGLNLGLSNHDVPPDELRSRGNAESDEDAGELTEDADEVSARNPDRTYQGDAVSVRMHNVTGVRESASSYDGVVTAVEVDLGDAQVSGTLSVRRIGRIIGRRRSGRHYEVRLDQGSACSCGEDDCEHREVALSAAQALVNARRITSAVGSWEQTNRQAATYLAASGAHSEASAQRPPRPASDGPAWADDDNADNFQGEYEAARARRDAGEAAVPFMSSDATGGLGDRDGGRGFGVEIEFDLDGVPDRSAALRAIGRDLHAAGLTSDPSQVGYHSAARTGYSEWSFERDSTVAGELVSPILYDEPEGWAQLQKACEIIKRHGGTASARTGSHVHIACDDYDHTVENHNRLLAMSGEYQDTMYRLAQNPERRAHRGTGYCTPNNVPSSGYNNILEVRSQQGRSYGSPAVNFSSVRGSSTDHVEFRMWDGTLDPAVIQTQVKLSLGMTEAAFRRDAAIGPTEVVGSHRSANSHLQRGQRLAGDAWKADTRSFRRLMDTVFWREADKRQATALFGVTRWQRR